MDPIDRDAIHEFRLRRMLALEQDAADRQQRLKPVYDRFEGGASRVVDIHEVGDEFQIVEVKRRGEEATHFHVFVGLKDTHNVAATFDQALLIALAAKYDRTASADYAARVLQLPWM